MIHLYTGGGKGKTTAAAGLAARMLGHGGKVLFRQFLKDGASGEISSLRRLGAEVAAPDFSGKFTFQMTPEELDEARGSHTACLRETARLIETGEYALAVLDEVLDALHAGIVALDDLLALIRSLPVGTELVLTGRNPPKELLALADYHTELLSRAHPFDKGAPARRGIEW